MPEAATQTETIVVERVIKASQETLYGFWTESDKITQWLAQSADLDPRPGGAANLKMGGHVEKDTEFSGENKFLVARPYTHVEFTWGFDNPQVGVPSGSSVVAVDLIPHDDGTLVRVTHRDLPAGRDESPYSERKGWGAMLEHLAEAAEA